LVAKAEILEYRHLVKNQSYCPKDDKRAYEQESSIIKHVGMFDMAGFVAEYGFDFLRPKILQKPVGEQDVAWIREHAGHHGIGYPAVRIPDHDVAKAEIQSPARSQQAVAQWSCRQRP